MSRANRGAARELATRTRVEAGGDPESAEIAGPGIAERCPTCASEEMSPRFPNAARPTRAESPHEPYRITWSRRDWIGEIRRCRACGVSSLPAFLRVSAARRYDDVFDPVYLSQEHDRVENARRMLEALPKGGSLLEVGCSCGFLLVAARAAGFEVEGVEPSAWAAGIARERYGLEVSHGFFPESRGTREEYDAIVFADVIEHVADPRSVLKAAYGRLRPGGSLLLLTPDAGSLTAKCAGELWWALLDDHLTYFTRSALRRMLIEIGFERPSIRSFGRSFPLRHWASKISQYGRFLERPLLGALRRLHLAEFRVSLNLGDQMLCIARRPIGGPEA